MIYIYIFIAIFIAWIWVDYFRYIDVFEKEDFKYFIPTFLLGGLSVLVIFGFEAYLLRRLHFYVNGNFINDFLFSILRIGLLEEFAKLLGFGLTYLIIRKQLNEPVDYLAYFCTVALGFSAVENVLYFSTYGPTLIKGRAILSTVSHMFNSAIMAYGIIRFKFHPSKPPAWSLIIFFLLSAFSHGIFDFLLLYKGFETSGPVLMLFYFFMTISLFAVILNNALNNSPFFTYKKVMNPSAISRKLLIRYGYIFLFQFIILTFDENILFALEEAEGSLFLNGTVIVISVVRLSRFKLIKSKWENLKPELPFEQNVKTDEFGPTRYHQIRVKGESCNESQANAFYNEFFMLRPLSRRKSYIHKPQIAYVEEKLFLKNDASYFLTKLYFGESNFETVLLKPKSSGQIYMKKGRPIVGILKFKEIHKDNTFRDFKFMGWAYMDKIKKTEADDYTEILRYAKSVNPL